MEIENERFSFPNEIASKSRISNPGRTRILRNSIRIGLQVRFQSSFGLIVFVGTVGKFAIHPMTKVSPTLN
ncbi:hypothetical protein DLM75_21105 [Leptospira stimsonii]|uniref:Uncharacterized protein n=1 Tax=Leptospira stimsonii TaxID=2202203 RepID=A0A396YS99_9LEPT|nr:hypothetical protein DLM75_21105 [Leptospira stimsonii]